MATMILKSQGWVLTVIKNLTTRLRRFRLMKKLFIGFLAGSMWKTKEGLGSGGFYEK